LIVLRPLRYDPADWGQRQLSWDRTADGAAHRPRERDQDQNQDQNQDQDHPVAPAVDP
jgi:hypothetical protein